MNIDNKIEYRCKRGHLELDLFLSKFYTESIKKLTTKDKLKLLSFLENDDLKLLKLLNNLKFYSSQDTKYLLKLIKNYPIYESKKGIKLNEK